MAKYILASNFLGPDGRMYRRADENGRTLVHDFPEDWVLPTKAKPLEEAVEELEAEAEPPEPETLAEIAKKQHGKK
ncbi:MAG TPA: hypothetical protein VK181_11220 [Rhizobium sp.]|nr:hypothetical protein [Rhizobium sp.]